MTILTEEVNRRFVLAWLKDRPRVKTDAFPHLLAALNGDELMAEIMWAYWGVESIKYLDWPKPEFNRHLRWWRFRQEKNTIRKLIQSPEGKLWVWQMLHDASAWL